MPKDEPIYLDDMPENADWIKTLSWGLPTEPTEFLAAIRRPGS